MAWRRQRPETAERQPTEDELALAREIGTRAAALAKEDVALGIDAIVDTVVGGLEAEQRRELVFSAFAELPAADRLDAMQRVFGDEAFAATLQLERERATRYGAFMHTAAELSAAATLSRQVNLLELPYGVETKIELCDQESLKEAKAYRDIQDGSPTCYRRLGALARPDGRLQVIEDLYWDNHGEQIVFAPNELAELGTATWEPDGALAGFEPVVTFGTPMHNRENRVIDPVRPIKCGQVVLAVCQISIGEQQLFKW